MESYHTLSGPEFAPRTSAYAHTRDPEDLISEKGNGVRKSVKKEE